MSKNNINTVDYVVKKGQVVLEVRKERIENKRERLAAYQKLCRK